MSRCSLRLSLIAALTTTLASSVAFSASAEPVFNRIASFAVADNLPKDADAKTEIFLKLSPFLKTATR